MIIGETTCDGKKKMYELLNELKRTHILHLPQGRDRAYERESWYEECRLLKEELEGFYGITITDDDLRAAVRRRNRLRAAQLDMFALQANQPAAMSGVDLMSNNQKDGGNSDYPNYPKPIITQYANPEKELEGILTRIQMEDLDDVAILVPSDKEVMMVNDYLANHGIKTQVMYRTGNTVPFLSLIHI